LDNGHGLQLGAILYGEQTKKLTMGGEGLKAQRLVSDYRISSARVMRCRYNKVKDKDSVFGCKC